MTKKGPLGKAELFYVKEHCQDLEAKEIAKELDRPIATVKKAVDKFIAEFPKDKQAFGTAGSQMARRDGIVTMTAGASQTADEKRSTKKRSRPSCVTTIHKE
jgi:hypothetical protein